MGNAGFVELRKGTLEVVPDQEEALLLEEFDGVAALFFGREGVEADAFEILAQDLHDAVGAGELLEADEAGAVGEEAGADPPMGRLGGQGGLAHATHRVEEDGAVLAELALQFVKLQGSPLETMARRAREGTGLARGGGGTGGGPFPVAVQRRADEVSDFGGLVGVFGGVLAVHPSQRLQVGREGDVLQHDGEDVLSRGVGGKGPVLLGFHPIRIEALFGTNQQGDPALTNAFDALFVQQAAGDFPGVEPHSQSMTVLQQQRQPLDARLVGGIVAQEHIELVRHRARRRQDGLVIAALVEVGQEPVAEFDSAGAGAEFEPAGGVGQERGATLFDGLADMHPLHEFAVETFEEDVRRLDVDGVAHRDDAADAGFDEAGRDGAEHGQLAEGPAAAGFEDDERHAVFD